MKRIEELGNHPPSPVVAYNYIIESTARKEDMELRMEEITNKINQIVQCVNLLFNNKKEK